MNQFWKFSSILAVLALLVVMGLSTQGSVQAQSVAPTSVCSSSAGGCTIVQFGNHDGDDGTTAEAYYRGAAPNGGEVVVADLTAANYNNVFSFSHTAAGTIEIQNLSQARVQDRNDAGTPTDDSDDYDNPDANPKKFTYTSGNVRIVAVHRSSGLTDTTATAGAAAGDDIIQVKAFNGDQIRVTYTPPTGSSTFADVTTVRVDNVRPSLLVGSPSVPLIVSDDVNITFSADFTDSASGFPSGWDVEVGPTSRQIGLSGSVESATAHLQNNSTDTDDNHVTAKGGVRLVLAGNVIGLAERDFTKIDGGWRLSKSFSSTAIQSIASNVPWYVEVRDRAGNTRRTPGSISGGLARHLQPPKTHSRSTGSRVVCLRQLLVRMRLRWGLRPSSQASLPSGEPVSGLHERMQTVIPW